MSDLNMVQFVGLSNEDARKYFIEGAEIWHMNEGENTAISIQYGHSLLDFDVKGTYKIDPEVLADIKVVCDKKPSFSRVKYGNIPVFKVKVVCENEVAYGDRLHLKSSKETAKMFQDIFIVDECEIDYKEYFYMAVTNRAMQLLGVFKISEGGMTGTVVDIKIIANILAQTNGCNLILCHNHPSGNTEPSNEDRILTNRIKEMCQHNNYNLTDHIILTPSQRYTSFGDDGIL